MNNNAKRIKQLFTKRRNNTLYIQDPVFLAEIWVLRGDDAKQFKVLENKIVEEIDKDSYHHTTDGIYVDGRTKEGNIIHIIWLKSKDITTLAHETLHCTNRILHLAGVKLNKGSEEVYTYYQGMLMRLINEGLQ